MKKEKSKQLPNISRPFTEALRYLINNKQKNIFLKNFFLVVIIICLLIFSIFMLIDLKQKVSISQALEVEKEKVISDISKWEKVIEKYPDYKDGYLTLSALEYRMKNFTKSKEYLQKVFEIDPNSKEGRKLESLLKNY